MLHKINVTHEKFTEKIEGNQLYLLLQPPGDIPEVPAVTSLSDSAFRRRN